MTAKPQTYRLALLRADDQTAQPVRVVIEGEPEVWTAISGGERWQVQTDSSHSLGVQTLYALEGRFVADSKHLPVCGTCTFWQGAADALKPGWSGYCCWLREGLAAHLAARQSVLASACPAYQPTSQPSSLTATAPALTAPERSASATGNAWRALARRMGRPVSAAAPQAVAIEDQIAEQSGKRPGTVACLNCQGVLANLGSITMTSAKGDDWTFSLWRCRNCEAYFLNDWVDAWVRTSSLEIVEQYYRLAPQQAFEALAQIARCAYASPQNKSVETPEKAWFRQFAAAQVPVFREIRHGK